MLPIAILVFVLIFTRKIYLSRIFYWECDSGTLLCLWDLQILQNSSQVPQADLALPIHLFDITSISDSIRMFPVNVLILNFIGTKTGKIFWRMAYTGFGQAIICTVMSSNCITDPNEHWAASVTSFKAEAEVSQHNRYTLPWEVGVLVQILFCLIQQGWLRSVTHH